MESTPINAQALPAGTRLEEFVIEGILGSGGFGVTYLARDTSLGRQVVRRRMRHRKSTEPTTH